MANPLKRKEPASDTDDAEPPSPKSQCKPTIEPTPTSSSGASSSGTATGPGRPDEYEAGRVICEACGTGVSFRDDDSGGFTLKHWEAHRITCPAASQRPPAPPIAYAPSTDPLSTHLSTALHASGSTMPSTSSGPHPPKRRRAKRTEEERIEYLRADPYVGQFEAYRVLCASCDKWIRLRPNSTYCSIPWDAHRKSCLAKKITTKNPYALSERNSLFAKDPDVRKFDPERLLCNICDRWLSLPPDDHLGAVQRWLSHRAACGRASGQPVDMHPPTAPGDASPRLGAGEGADHHHAPAGSLSPRSPSAPQPAGTRPAGGASQNGTPALAPLAPAPPSSSTTGLAHAPSPPSPYLLTPLTYAPAHESRRRNAEQRAATLRADRLIGRVEPNRWVQLRQDSSYCAYPWVQHRGSHHHQHHQQRYPGHGYGRAHHRADEDEDELMSADGEEGGGGADEDGDDGAPRAARRARARAPRGGYGASTAQGRMAHAVAGGSATYRPASSGRGAPSMGVGMGGGGRAWDGGAGDDADAEGEPDAEAEWIEEIEGGAGGGAGLAMAMARGVPRRPWPVGLADLDSPAGRKHFIQTSLTHLFSTTYEPADELSVSALLTYLNAAMPPDKHEDFDTAEVARAVAALAERGKVVFEGDIVRVVE
ncbi:hypothetical protein BJ912DRAFT_1021349 [Pholiota molesta]|nr:hypothetical protein BJ912DRAFT_1021349 [Pholiota molesta]